MIQGPQSPGGEPRPRIEGEKTKSTGWLSAAANVGRGLMSLIGVGKSELPVVEVASEGRDVSSHTLLLDRGVESGVGILAPGDSLVEGMELKLEFRAPEHSYGKELFAGYGEYILENHGEAFRVVLDAFESDEMIEGFDRAKYEADPMQLFIDFQNDYSAQRAVSGKIEGSYREHKYEFIDAWREMKAGRHDYFVKLGNSYFETEGVVEGLNPKMLMENYEAWQVMNEEMDKDLDRLHEAGADEWDGNIDKSELDELHAAFDAKWGEGSANEAKREELFQGWYAPYREYYKGLSMEFLKRDAGYMEALQFIQNKKAEVWVEGMDTAQVMDKLNGMFNHDKAFREAVVEVFDKERNVREMLGVYQADEDGAEERMLTAFRADWGTFSSAWSEFSEEFSAQVGKDMARAGQAAGDAAQYLKDNPGRTLLMPATVGAAILLSSPVTVPAMAVGGVFTYHVGKRVIPPVMSHLVKEGVFADVEAAKADRAVKLPVLERLYARESTRGERLEALEDLRGKGLLFIEDLEMAELADIKEEFLRGLGDEVTLPTKAGIEQMRKQWLPTLRRPFESDDLKLQGLKEMHKAGVLFASDFEMPQVIDPGLKARFFAEVETTEDDLQTAEQFKAARNLQMFLARQQVGMSVGDKVVALAGLHEKGILFQQDLEKIRDRVVDGGEVVDKFLAQIGMSMSELPDIKTHYTVTKLSLQRKHDEVRLPFLGLLKAEGNAGPEDRELALKNLHGGGILFREDVEGVVEEDVLKQVLGITGFAALPERATFYDVGWGEQFKKIGEVTAGMLVRGGKAVYNDPVNIVYGPMKGTMATVSVATQALAETFGSYTDVDVKPLTDRIARSVPTDAQLKKAAAFTFNKSIGTVKWSVMGAAVGTSVMGIFGAKIGAAIGGLYGFCRTNGRVSQVPKGGFLRAFKFSAKGALVGAVVPPILGAVATGLGVAGLIGMSTAIGIATMGLGLIIPCILFGIFMGFQIAGWTGKDAPGETLDPVMESFRYSAPSNVVMDVSLAITGEDEVEEPSERA